MQPASREKLKELQQIISRMPLDVCCMTVVPEFGLRWREVSRAVRNNRLPIAPSSVARVLSRHAGKSIPDTDVADIVARLRLKLVATQERKWYVVDLLDPIDEDISIGQLINELPGRVAQALRNTRGGRNMRPEVETVLLGDLLYMSVRMVSDSKEGSVLYVATPMGQPVVLVSSVTSGLLKGCVAGLGYSKFEDAQLYGRDVNSLLRIHNRQHDENVDHLVEPPEYNPQPTVTPTGIDYTYKSYNEQYINDILGPDPPLLTELTIKSSKPFYDPGRLDKTINLTVNVKSEDIAKSLKSWVNVGALNPTSELFYIFHKVKSNKIVFRDEE